MMQLLRKTMRNGSATTILALLMGLGGVGIAAAGTRPASSPPQRSAPPAQRSAPPASRPAAQPARPSGGGGYGGGARPSNTNGGGGSRYTTAPGGGSHPGSTTGGGSHYTTTTGGGSHFTTNSGGSHTGTAPGGNSHPTTQLKSAGAPKGSNAQVTKSGSMVRTRANGKPSDVHDAKTGTNVHHGLNGNRRVSVNHPDHSRVVSEKGRAGYVQHPYKYHGHDLGRRTYSYHGHAYSHDYYGYGFRGMYLDVYAPGLYFNPYFYGWAYNPWAMPIAFGWGWGGSPWFGYYGYYFTPYDSYPSASYWLTDYMISEDLQADYAAQQDAGEVDGAAPAAGGPPELTPEVKQQIADEVRTQLALENQEAQQNANNQDVDPGSSSVDRMFADAGKGKPHILVAGAPLDVVDSSGTECSLSDGDVLALRTAPATDAKAADVVVLASKGGQECQKQATVSIALDDLQEMQNSMRAIIDQGLQELQAKQGTGGLPAEPASAKTAPAQAQYDAIAPPPDPNADSAIQQQAQQGDQAEKDVTTEASKGGGQ